MNAAEFKTKWAKVSAKESAAYQSHFDDLCRLLKLPTPLEADPTGDFFCFQKRVIKDAEFFDVETPDASEPDERGFADVWKKGCFAWEYKGKKKNLDEAYKQLLRYRESLLNPPLLVVCDFDRYIIKTNFNGTVQEKHEFTNADIDRPENLKILRAVFSDPDFLKPQRTTAQVTENLAETIADVARSLQKREAEELADARTRAEMNFAQRKYLRIARFLNRIVFCFFAEDTGLLPKHLFSDLLKTGVDDLHHFAETLEKLFQVMAKGGTFGKDKIRHFNGHLFEDSTVFELTEDELKQLADAGEADWQFIQPGIMGTLFERALDFEEGGKLRAQLGAHYTSEADIKTLVEPVLMAPLRREWSALKGELAAAYAKGKGTPAQRDKLAAFQKKLAGVSVLDPACGSGNFLYVSLQLLLDLEKEAVTFATQLGFKLAPQVSVQQLRAIEINPYAFELAQVSVQIGFLQWRRDNGFDNDRSPVLQNLDGFQNEDALLVPHFRSKAKTLKEAQAGEHKGDDALKFYTERDWPKCDTIVSNPPFLGGSEIKEELGLQYQKELWRIYEGRLPGFADLCCYWFEKAREQIENGKCSRAGLLATQSIRGGANREVLKRIKETGDIFFAESDRPWILAGAAVNVSMVGFDNGKETLRSLDSLRVSEINPNLSSQIDTTTAIPLESNRDISFQGSQKIGPFDIPESLAREWLNLPNPHSRPNSDVLIPLCNGIDLIRRSRGVWIIDFGLAAPVQQAALYEMPFQYVEKNVKPERDTNPRDIRRINWWKHGDGQPAMRAAISPLTRCVAISAHTKHLIFTWLQAGILPDKALIVFARSDDYFFGVLHSRFQEVWGLKLGTQLEDRPRYTPTTSFETFPFPRPTPAQEAAIAAAAKELNELRERWLNPPEWTRTEYLEFPASVDGPWARYVECGDLSPLCPPARLVGQAEPRPAARGKTSADKSAHSKIGMARYPRLVPKDADCAAKLKKRTLTNLYNERPAWLDLAHKKLDAAVAAAYGWPADLSDEQILEKLLALNLERSGEEAKASKTKRPKTQRAKTADELV